MPDIIYIEETEADEDEHEANMPGTYYAPPTPPIPPTSQEPQHYRDRYSVARGDLVTTSGGPAVVVGITGDVFIDACERPPSHGHTVGEWDVMVMHLSGARGARGARFNPFFLATLSGLTLVRRGG